MFDATIDNHDVYKVGSEGSELERESAREIGRERHRERHREGETENCTCSLTPS